MTAGPIALRAVPGGERPAVALEAIGGHASAGCVCSCARLASPGSRHGVVLIRNVDLTVEDVRDIAPRNDLRRTIQNETAR